MTQPTTSQLVLTNFKYQQANGFNLYPEQLALPWHDLLDNPNRRELKLPKSWKGIRPKPERTGLPIYLEKLSQEQLDSIVANATTREDFHDYNWHASEDGGWGRCLCEIRIATGKDCVSHLTEGGIAAPGEYPKNKHWAWFIDCAPRGKICPNARLTRHVIMGKPQLEKQACRRIMLKPPPEHWVLARNPGDTVPGRAVSDILRNGPCYACDPNKDKYRITAENEVFKDQKFKTEPDRKVRYRAPLRYQPTDGKIMHGTLLVGDWYHEERLNQLGVPYEHMYSEEHGKTLAALHQGEADAAAAADAANEQPFA